MSQLYIKFLYQHVKKLHDDRKYIISNYQKLHEEYLDQRNIIIFQDEKEKLEDFNWGFIKSVLLTFLPTL